jgi:hypothetical protein
VFVRTAQDLNVLDKKFGKIDCEVLGIPMPTVEFYKDGVLVQNSANVVIECSKNKVINSLTFKSVTSENAGKYTLKAKNDLGEVECSAYVSVDLIPFIITSLPEKVLVPENGKTQLQCFIGGSPTPTIAWIKKGDDVVSGNGIDIYSDGDCYTLSIDSAKLTDAGVFNITAQNRVGKVTCKTELIVQIAPRFIRKIQDTQVVEKRLTKLEAEILAVPKPEIVWYKNGEIIKCDDRIQSHDAKGGVYQLSIKNSRKDDTGVYVCKAINSVGESECTAQLVIEMAPQFLKKLDKVLAVESCEAEWTFQLIGIPKPVIVFAINTQEIDFEAEKSFYSLEELDDHVYNIKFSEVRKKDVGNWTCTATNSAGTASCIAKLDTQPLCPPSFIKELSKLTRLPQEVENKLSVDVAGVPFPKIEWFKEGKSIDFDTQSDKYKLERDLNTGTWSLVISNCKIDSDSGIYKARIYNPGGECSCEGTVAVKGFAPRFIEKPEKIYALTNEVATFVAVVEGDPTPTVEWSKGKNILQDNNDIKIYYDQENDLHIMEISNCKPKDAGTYQVTAINEFGTDLAPVTLIITHNPEDVVDLKDQLKNRGGRRSVDNSNDPDWGKLKKGKAGIKDADQDPDWGKLKKVIRDKPQQEEQIKEEQVLPDRKPFVPKEFGPRDTDLETYEKKPKEKDDEGKVSDPDLKRKSAPTTETAPGGKEFTKLLVDMTVPEHKLGVFECSVSDAKAEVVWFFNDNQTDKMQTKKRFQTMSIGLFRRLAIRNPLIHESDSKVTCKWDDLETTAKLFVIDCPIKFMKGLKNQKVPKNSTVLLECQISNDLKPLAPLTFAWKKNGKPLDIETNKDKYEFTVTGDKYCLKVNDFIETDEAEYEIYLVDPEDWDISSKGNITIIGYH